MLLFASRAERWSPFISWDTQRKKKRETNIKNKTIRVYTRKYVLCREMESPPVGGWGALGNYGPFFSIPLFRKVTLIFRTLVTLVHQTKAQNPPIGSTALLWGSSLLTDSQVAPGFLTAQMSSKVALQQKQLFVLYPAAACG